MLLCVYTQLDVVDTAAAVVHDFTSLNDTHTGRSMDVSHVVKRLYQHVITSVKEIHWSALQKLLEIKID